MTGIVPSPALNALDHAWFSIGPSLTKRWTMGTEKFDPETLPQGLSHILIETPRGGLRFDPGEYLHEKGVTIESEVVRLDSEGREWLVLSVKSPDISDLILELLEMGLSGNIRGMSLKEQAGSKRYGPP